MKNTQRTSKLNIFLHNWVEDPVVEDSCFSSEVDMKCDSGRGISRDVCCKKITFL